LGSKAENSSFLRKLTENIKQVQDARDPENESANERLYVICDIVLWLLTNKTHTISLKDFPGNPVLPKKTISGREESCKGKYEELFTCKFLFKFKGQKATCSGHQSK